MNNVLKAVALVLALSMSGAGFANAATENNNGTSETCQADSVTSGFAQLDRAAVAGATRVQIVPSNDCGAAASSVRSNPSLVSEITSNPAYNTALRAGGYPNTDITGATLDGNTLIVYIHDRS